MSPYLYMCFRRFRQFLKLWRSWRGHPNTSLAGPPSTETSRKGFRHFTIGFLHLRTSFSTLFYMRSALSAFSAFLGVLVRPPNHLACRPARQVKTRAERFSALYHRISASQKKLLAVYLYVFSTFGIFCISGSVVGGRPSTLLFEVR